MGIFTEHWYCPTPIPVTERLPDKDGKIVLIFREGHWAFGAVIGNDWYWIDHTTGAELLCDEDFAPPTHWIELPPHPDAGKW